jgi:NADPH:quinone reductase
MGADYMLDHRQPLPSQLASYGYKTVDFIANFNNTDAYWASMAEMIRPQGAIVAIVENTGPLDLNVLKSKSVTFVWEFMFTLQCTKLPTCTNRASC